MNLGRFDRPVGFGGLLYALHFGPKEHAVISVPEMPDTAALHSYKLIELTTCFGQVVDLSHTELQSGGLAPSGRARRVDEFLGSDRVCEVDAGVIGEVYEVELDIRELLGDALALPVPVTRKSH